jgi:hypothetical protein
MRITGTRIRTLDRYLRNVPVEANVVVGLAGLPAHAKALGRLGFSSQLHLGETVLPAADLGRTSEFNAEGKEVPDKTKPMETAYRTVEWHWEEFRGRYDRVQQSKFVDVPYQRYPRIRIPPPSVELTLRETQDGETVVTARPMRYDPKKPELLLHTINLFLEIFGECAILDERLSRATAPATVLLNWRVLPPGQYPWSKVKPLVTDLIRQAPEGNRPIITARLESISAYGPEFVAVGTAGFHGYLVFGFPKKRLFVLEAIQVGNATYVFDKNWQQLSQLSKAEILDRGLQKHRIVHLLPWFSTIRDLLK